MSETRKTTFSQIVKSTREAKSLSQAALAQMSRVSTRTIVAIEDDRSNQHPRPDVIIRLAHALEQEPEEWLRHAGHNNIPAEKIQHAIREVEITQRNVAPFRFRGEMDPSEFFASLKSRLTPRQPVLICVGYPAIPGSVHRADVQKILIELFNKGLWVAMVCPFPRVTEIEGLKHRTLAKHYRDVYEHVIELATGLRERLPAERKKQLAVFVPKQAPKQGKRMHLVMPLMGISEYRPSLIKYFADGEQDDDRFELAAWVTLQQDRKDRWIGIYPPADEEHMQSRLQVLKCWRDYFSDIVQNCDPKKGEAWKPKDFQETEWDIADLAASD